ALEQWDKAAECFEQVADDLLYTTPFYPLTNLGYIYYQTGEYEKAEKYYNEALDLEYDFPKALHGLGQVYMATGDINKAVRYLERAKEKAPKSARICMDLGRLWRLFFCPLQILHGLVYITSGHIHLPQAV
ncbi:tetratricopeptide repeat protein, partial [Desulfosalsimonas sp.]|uniref:tetratricopeptide repeat protein n=1 Tax=Desulfosalsimonas sp. TaxID=3073848 RepID=UPI003970AE9D